MAVLRRCIKSGLHLELVLEINLSALHNPLNIEKLQI